MQASKVAALLILLPWSVAAVATSCAALTGLDDFILTGSTSSSGGGSLPDGGAGGVTVSTGGTGGSGGSAGGAGGNPNGCEGAGGASPDAGSPGVPCGTGQGHVEACPTSEFCCSHETFTECDTCSDGGTCTAPSGTCGGLSNYRLLRCNGPEDCPARQQCCAEVTKDTLCAVTCSASQKSICGGPEHCPADKPCCVNYDPPYPGYKYCSATPP